MKEKRSFLTRPLCGYYQNQVPGEDAELTHVGPGTPGGEYLRRFWHPVSLTSDLGELPRAIRILGEDLVIFRDGGGHIGLLHRHCSHRGTSLEYGVIEERGIRCCYHGWLYDTDGRILETPAEPPSSTYKDRLCHGAYPVHEYGGLVFAYMGPPDEMPPFPIYDSFDVPGFELGLGNPVGFECVKPCNWLQIMDNVVDPVHEPFLHARSSGYQFVNEDGLPVSELEEVGEFDFRETPIGIACLETRRIDEHVWVRTIEYICPNIAQIPRTPIFPPRYREGRDELVYVPLVTRWRVPIDDANTAEFAFVRVGPGEENTYITNPGPVVRTNYGGRSYEETQREPGDFEAQIGQRAIARHGLEHLGATDRGVIMMRRMVREGIRAVAAGKDPKGLHRRLDGPIATYGSDTVRRIPPAASPEADSAILREAMAAAIERSLASPPIASTDVFAV